jgi:hypothetical protein
MAIQGMSTISNKSHISIVAEVNVARTLNVISTSGQWSSILSRLRSLTILAQQNVPQQFTALLRIEQR